jgi:hypothetical protein
LPFALLWHSLNAGIPETPSAIEQGLTSTQRALLVRSAFSFSSLPNPFLNPNPNPPTRTISAIVKANANVTSTLAPTITPTGRLQELFDKRSIYTKSAIESKFTTAEEVAAVGDLLPRVAYRFSNGPFRGTFTKCVHGVLLTSAVPSSKFFEGCDGRTFALLFLGIFRCGPRPIVPVLMAIKTTLALNLVVTVPNLLTPPHGMLCCCSPTLKVRL